MHCLSSYIRSTVMMKRLLSIFVLVIFLAHFAGFYIYFAVQLKQVRKEMRSKLKELPPEELDLIILTTEEYQSAKVEEHEIKVGGKMYDIAWVEEGNETIRVFCLHDKDEDNLLAFMNKILSVPLKGGKVPPQIIKFTSLSFIVPPTFRCLDSLTLLDKSLTDYNFYVLSFIPSLESPPPRLSMLF